MTNGFGAMPDYRAQIAPRDRWAIAAYVRALQLSQHAPAADVPGGEPAEALATPAAGGRRRRRSTAVDRMETHALTTDVAGVARLQQRGLMVGVAGLLAGASASFLHPDQFFRSWLIGFLFCLGLSLGCLALLMLQHMTRRPVGPGRRRIFEAGSRLLPLVRAAVHPAALRLPKLYLWAQPEAVADDAILQLKAPYLNVPFFIGRAVVYFAVWMFCACLLNKWSAAQDRGELARRPKPTRARFRVVSAPGLMVYVTRR